MRIYGGCRTEYPVVKGEHTHTRRSIKELLINQEAIHFGV